MRMAWLWNSVSLNPKTAHSGQAVATSLEERSFEERIFFIMVPAALSEWAWAYAAEPRTPHSPGLELFLLRASLDGSSVAVRCAFYSRPAATQFID